MNLSTFQMRMKKYLMTVLNFYRKSQNNNKQKKIKCLNDKLQFNLRRIIMLLDIANYAISSDMKKAKDANGGTGLKVQIIVCDT